MRGIPFTNPMVGKVMDGTKTQTRRIMSPQPHPDFLARGLVGVVVQPAGINAGMAQWFMADGMSELRRCPYGGRGPLLYVKEMLRPDPASNVVTYAVGGATFLGPDGEPVPWPWKVRVLPSRYMPRRFARTVVEVSEVRAQRLQAITEADAVAEGAVSYPCPTTWAPNGVGWTMFPEHVGEPEHALGTARNAFGNAWNVIHGGPRWNLNGKPVPWDINVWVWALTFCRRFDSVDLLHQEAA